MSRLLIAGTNSGCGKTTLTCALLAALTQRGLTPAAFKCGPDYIDPMFHRRALGLPSYNLDPFFLDGAGLRRHLAAHTGALAVLEGAMGYYDGIAGTSAASAYTVAAATQTPAVLVVSARGAGASLGAVIEGFVRHRPDSRIAGVIFNHAPPSRSPDLEGIAAAVGVRAYGCLPHREGFALPHRHLGLHTPGEIAPLQEILAQLGRQAQESLDIDGLLALADTAPALPLVAPAAGKVEKSLRLAVARDEAFCFLYQENLDLLQQLGCEIVFFSPLHDPALPPEIDGLYLCGGYPERFVRELEGNLAMRRDIQGRILGGLPTIAECGGFLYLHQSLDGAAMCGVIPGNAFETKRLQRFGYHTLVALEDSLLARTGEDIPCHEFHYWDTDSPGGGFVARKAGRETSHLCVHVSETLYAGFPHLYFPARPILAQRLIERMREYGAT